MIRRLMLAALLLVVAGAGARTAAAADEDFTDRFRLQDCRFQTRGANPYFILEPGRRLVLEGDDDGTVVTVVITVLRQTRTITLNIGGVPTPVVTRIVEEREFEDGELVEVSRNFFAICEPTNDVYYFGETVAIFEDGQVVSHAGAWLAGRDGARPGIIMPGTFLLGARYFQELAPGVALDQAEHVDMGRTVRTPFRTMRNCVAVHETTPLEPGAVSRKLYCPGVGLAVDDVVRLVDVIEDVGAGAGEDADAAD
jgi:hypothetical protein